MTALAGGSNSPTTPRKRKKCSEEHQVKSPYFSPCRISKLNGASNEELGTLELSCNISATSIGGESVTSTREASYEPEDSNLLALLDQLEKVKPLLIQETVADDPWKLLIAVTLLNKTAGKLAIPTFWDILEKWPTPLELSQADGDELTSMIRHLGTQTIRSKRLIALSKWYLQQPPSIYDLRSSKVSASPQRKSRFFSRVATKYPATPISHLPGTGSYALDSYRIFCTAHDNPESGEWKLVMPTDKELIRYLKWKWAFIGRKEWSPSRGAIRPVTSKYLTALVVELQGDSVRLI